MHEKNEYPMKVNGSVSLSSKLRSHMPRLSRAALPCQIPGMAANGMGVWAREAGSGGRVGAGEATGDGADAGAAGGIGAGVGKDVSVSAGGAALSAGGAVAFGGSAAGAGEIGAAGAGALTCSLFRCAARTACRW